MMQKTSLLFLSLILSACASNPFLDAYNTINPSSATINSYKEIKLIETTDLKNRVLEYKEKGYMILGVAHLTGEWKNRTYALKAAKEKGANLVILSSHFTGAQKHSYVAAIPQTQTTYHQGNIQTSSYTTGHIGGYNGINYSATTTGNASYSGTSTTIGTSYFQASYETALFDQTAIFLFKSERI